MQNKMKKRVLIVDDDPDILTTYKEGLEDYGLFEVSTFDDPEEALSNFKSDLYDCFITAYEVNYEALRKVFPTLGLECFIQKPIEVSQLVRKINAELK
jgi:DNA-binding NtrC family response regulator